MRILAKDLENKSEFYPNNILPNSFLAIKNWSNRFWKKPKPKTVFKILE
jgi:hypothetical protein